MHPEDELEGVAIIGMAGRFPGAANVEEFWANLVAGRESITHFSPDEIEASPPPGDRPDDATFVCAKGLLDDVDQFDPKFWGYTPREAALIDPQQRLFLECAANALEDGGVDPDRTEYAIGTYAGCYMPTYLFSSICGNGEGLADLISSIQVGSLQTELGNDKDYVATRCAYKLNLKGPAINVQTACSTSLVAIAMAYQAIQSYQCDMALAGGATITLPQKRGYFYTEGSMLSKDGHCRAFDQDAAGTVFSNASAAILLKRLSDAVADGDHIYAVLKGAATNNDGASKLSFTAPSVQGQAEVISMAQALADFDPRTIGYIEAHGTATPLGDPIEVAGLTQAFREGTDDNQFCALGSVKTNIGHLDCASGVVGVIKTALMLKTGIMPPSLNYNAPNPNIDFANTPFYVNAECREWPNNEWPRRAGVSSFGVGGTNAHVVLEQPPESQVNDADSVSRIFPVSAKSKKALVQAISNLSEWCDAHPEADLSLVANTLQRGRRVYNHRASFAASDVGELRSQLNKFKPRKPVYTSTRLEDPPLVFMFPGQGAQHPGMARGLYDSYSVFRTHFDECAALLNESVGIDLLDVVFKNTDAEVLKRTEFAQPAIFSVEYALAMLWQSWGAKPAALIGHSVGEYCAAVLAEVMALDDALRIVARRGEYMQGMAPGGMLSVRSEFDAISTFIEGPICLAAQNAPELQVLAGPTDALAEVAKVLEAKGVAVAQLHTSHAFHSTMMDAAVEPTIAEFDNVSLNAAKIPMMSTVDVAWLTPERATSAAYWADNIRSTVRFAPGVDALLEEGYQVFLEVGPGRTLSTLAHQCAGTRDMISLSSLGQANGDQADDLVLMGTAGQLWQAGWAVDWQQLPGATEGKLPLPSYPFEYRRCWIDPPAPNEQLGNTQAANDAAAPQAVEQLIRQQLAIVAQQIELLRGNG